MSTISEVKAGLDDIAQTIRTERQAMANAKARISAGKNNLAAIPAQHAAVIAQIDAYIPTGAHETLAQDEKAKLAVEFQTLKDAAATAELALGSIAEF
jgi:hypothetical protein